MRRLCIVGNDAFMVHAMRFALQYAPGVSLFAVIDGHGGVREAIREANPDLVIVDGITGDEPGVHRLAEIREEAPGALIVMLSAPMDDVSLRVALDAGAMVCLSSSLRAPELTRVPDDAPVPVLTAGLPAGASGHADAAPAAQPATESGSERAALTARELEILRAVAEGHTNARIGRQLWVTEQTVKFHLSNIYRKLGVSNRTEASRYALMYGLVAMPRRAAHDARTVPVGGVPMQRVARPA
jgi:DNA-binding NarL/FixJ family response regulator